MNKPQKHYDTQKKNKASTAFTLRAMVGAYIVYLTWQIAAGTVKGESSIPVPLVVLICVVFLGATAWFVTYAWKEYQKALKDAEVTEEEMQAELEAADKEEPSGE